MSHQVIWTKDTLENFLEWSGINDRIALGDSKAVIQEGIMRTRVANFTIVKQAETFNCSVDCVKKYIAELKILYDEVQKQHPEDLPIRITNSQTEAKLDKE